jgi:hypothetical protein
MERVPRAAVKYGIVHRFAGRHEDFVHFVFQIAERLEPWLKESPAQGWRKSLPG